MKDRKEKLAASLTAKSTALIPYLPYLLQDLWELGSSPRDICALLEADTPISEDYHVLDLGCGKGAVSIVMAERFKCHVKGIDLLPEFIEEAEQRAIDYGVADICQFKVGDITESVNEEKNYDSVIYGAVGDVLGEPVDMINQLKQTVRAGGYIIIGDGYALDDDADYYTKKEWLSFFKNAEMTVIDEKEIEQDEVVSLCHHQIEKITHRANELKMRYPEAPDLFDSYITSQKAECKDLTNEVIGVTFLLQSK